MKIAFFILLISASAFAQDFLNCQDLAKCQCPKATQTRSPLHLGLKDTIPSIGTFMCREMSITLKMVENVVTPKVECEDEVTDTLYDRVQSGFPSGCGYSVRTFRARGFKENIERVVAGKTVLCDPQHNSQCVSAIFLAFIFELQELKKKGLVTNEQIREWSDVHNPPYKYLNDQTRPDLLLSSLGIGTGKTLRKSEIPQEDWPKKGDFVQIWRNDNSGHSTVFSGFLKDSDGKVQGMCFWSSNLGTDGYGNFCEDINNVNRIVIGRVNK